MSDGPASNPPEPDGGPPRSEPPPGQDTGPPAGDVQRPPGPWPPPGQDTSPWPPPGQDTGPWPPPGQDTSRWPTRQGSAPWPPPGGQGWPPPNPPGYGAPGHGGPGYGGPGYGGYGAPGYPGYGAPWPPPAPKPGVIPLRPIGLGEILDGSIATIRRNPKATLGFTAVVMAVSTVISTVILAGLISSLQRFPQRASANQQLTSADFKPLLGWLATYGAVSLLLALAVSVILTGTLTAVVAHAVLGRQATLRQAWQQARGRIGALAGLTLLILAIFLGLWAVLIGAAVAGSVALGPGGVALAVLSFIALVTVTIFLWIKISVAPAAVVLERASPTAAIGRSWRLTRQSFWRVFGIWIVAYLVVVVAGLVLQVPFRIIGAIVTGTSGLGFGTPSTSLTGGNLIAYLVIGGVGNLVAATVTRPMIAGVAALLYIDLRMRREGLDMALQATAGRELAAGDEFASVWQTPEPGSWGSGRGPGPAQEPGLWGPDARGPDARGPDAQGQGVRGAGEAGPVAPPDQGGSGPGAPPGQGTPPW